MQFLLRGVGSGKLDTLDEKSIAKDYILSLLIFSNNIVKIFINFKISFKYLKANFFASVSL